VRRYELSDEQWDLLQEGLPRSGRGGQWKDHRLVINAILWVLHTGAPWRDLPGRYGPWQTAYDRFNRWSKDGTWKRLLERLHVRLDEQGKIDWETWCVDTTTVRASRAAAGAGEKGAPRSRPITPSGGREAA
jgi:transposase